jgi:hypothetical protein
LRFVLRLAASLALIGLAAGQCVVPTLPSTYVLLGVAAAYDSNGLPDAGPLKLFKFTPSDTTPWGSAWSLGPSPVGNCPTQRDNPTNQCARSDIAPAIASSNAIYVAAWWGPKNDPNLTSDANCAGGSQLLGASFDPTAGTWTPASRMTCLAGDHLGPASRPALVWAGETNVWYLAFADAKDGSVTVLAFPGPGSSETQVAVPCCVAGAVAIGESAVKDPATGQFVPVLYLAWNDGSLHTLKSMNGATFTNLGFAREAGDQEAGNTLPGITANLLILPPFMGATIDGPLLAVSRASYAGNGNEIALFTTSDGVTWTWRVALAGVPGATITPAVTGAPATPVISYPNGPTAEFLGGEPTTAVAGPGGTVVLPMSQSVGVGMAFGPGF